MRFAFRIALSASSLCCGVCATAAADDHAAMRSRIKAAAQRTIPIVEQAMAGSADQRECFTCHHQAVPILALTAAEAHGLTVDRTELDRQVDHTVTHLQRGYENYLHGQGQGGQIATAGYALLALDAAEWPAGETTEAVVHYLLQHQREAPHYSQDSNRPPTSGSSFTATFLAVNGMQSYGTESQQPAIEERLHVLRDWALSARPDDTEDAVFRLALLSRLDVDPAQRQQAVQTLLERQRDDGGWAQRADMDCDPYATATAMHALVSVGRLSLDDTQIRRGLTYLLDTQQSDGTWYVQTRADGFQPYFESGFPYEEDQFISMAATSWSLLALVEVLAAAVPDAVPETREGCRVQ